MVKLAILLCNTRTGSTAFGHGLSASNGGVIFAGEIFHPDAETQPDSLFGWLRREGVAAYDFLSCKEQVLSQFLSACLEGKSSKLLLLDLKYHDVFNLMTAPALLDFPAALFGAVRNLGGSIIHLKRRNKFYSVMSQLVAEGTGVFHIAADAEVVTTNVTTCMSEDNLIYQIKNRVLHELILSRQVSNSNCPAVDIFYEDIFGAGRGISIQSVRGLLNLDLALDHFVHKKLNFDYRAIVENYAELEAMAFAFESSDWKVNEF